MQQQQHDIQDSPPNSQHNIQIRVIEPPDSDTNNPFSALHMEQPNMLGGGLFIDDEFKLNPNPQQKNISLKRLVDLYPAKTPLFIDMKTGRDLSNPTVDKINIGKPKYLSQLNMLPFEHFRKLIQPSYINQKGYYHVVMWKQGIMTKQIIDDTVYYDEKMEEIYSHPALSKHAWVHILLKAWAKRHKSYDSSEECSGFQFIKAFSYPDWQYINPLKQTQLYLNSRFTRAKNYSQFLICKTKSDPNIGLYGFTTQCASFIIKKHHQEYERVFLVLQPFVHDCWNQSFCNQNGQFPQDPPKLEGKQFYIPMEEFLNVFNLIYATKNKYSLPRKNISSKNSAHIPRSLNICYEKYILNVDARDTKAIVLGFQLTQLHGFKESEIPVSINFYFPSIKIFDIVNQPRHGFHMPGDLVVPWAKILIAQYFESGNADASYVESVKQKILDYGQNMMGFTSYNPSYQFVAAEYFQGYSNQITYNLDLKPGKYYMRIKIQQKQSEYRCHINSTAINGKIKIFDPKINDSEQFQMLKDCIISKAKLQKKSITYINPIKKGSWIICRNQLDLIGYGYFVAQMIKNPQNKIIVIVNPKKIRQHGYQIKGGKKDLTEHRIELDSEQTFIKIVKYDKKWKGGERVWPPPGIEFIKVPKVKPK